VQDLTIDGRLYECDEGHVWLVGRRAHPESPAMATRIDTGELVIYEPHRVARWIDLKLTAVLRWLDSVNSKDRSTR
jgi:hypothetical protein